MHETVGTKPDTLQTVVTYLEMDRRPSRHIAVPSGLRLTMLKVSGVPLHFYRYLQYRVGGQWHWVSRQRLDDAALSAIVHGKDVEIEVLYADGAPAGFFEVDHDCRRDGKACAELSYFGLMEHVTGRGIGPWFLSQAIDCCWSKEPAKVIINTCTLDHPAALPLYQKFGFRPVRRETVNLAPLTELEHQQLALGDGPRTEI